MKKRIRRVTATRERGRLSNGFVVIDLSFDRTERGGELCHCAGSLFYGACYILLVWRTMYMGVTHCGLCILIRSWSGWMK